MTTLFLAAMRFQAQSLRRSVEYLLSLVTIPALTLAFLAIVRNSGRADLVPYAVLGAAMMTIWATALFVCGEMIESERFGGTLEGLLAAPAPFAVVILGRITLVTLVSFLGIAESWLIAWLVFGVVIPVPHWPLLLLTLLCTAFAMIGTSSIMSAMFVLARSARIFQNSLSYPFYLLGGLVVPVSLLPGWLQPFTRAIFLSWAADLLRDCLRPAAVTGVAPRLAVIVGLGALSLAVGLLLTRTILRRIRQNGSVGYA
jgi:ABC-2 type transport system permease protein